MSHCSGCIGHTLEPGDVVVYNPERVWKPCPGCPDCAANMLARAEAEALVLSHEGRIETQENHLYRLGAELAEERVKVVARDAEIARLQSELFAVSTAEKCYRDTSDQMREWIEKHNEKIARLRALVAVGREMADYMEGCVDTDAIVQRWRTLDTEAK